MTSFGIRLLILFLSSKILATHTNVYSVTISVFYVSIEPFDRKSAPTDMHNRIMYS